MRKLTTAMIIALALLGGCGDDGDAGTPPEDVVETTADALDELPKEEFVVVDGKRTAITESCVDTSGVYKGQLRGGGLFILRGGSAPEELFVDFQPSAEADPLSSQSAADTVLTQQGAVTTGNTTVTTEDGANSLELAFQIQPGEVDESC